MSKKFHIKNNGNVGPCTARNTCPLGINVPHFDSKQDAEKYITENNKKEFDTLLFKRISKDSISNSKGIKDKRIYEFYKKERNNQRNSPELIERSGSRFNNTVESVAKTFGITMSEAKDGIYKQYALDKKITEEEARDHFDITKKNRIKNYENTTEFNNAEKVKHQSYGDYKNYVKIVAKAFREEPWAEAFIKESKRVHSEHFTDSNKRKELREILNKEIIENNEIDENLHDSENFAKIETIIILEDIDKKK